MSPLVYPLLIIDLLLSLILLLPISDERGPYKNFASATIVLIGVNVGVFLYTEYILPRQMGDIYARAVVFAFSLTPERIWTGENDVAVTMVSAAFLHSGPLHLASNMFYLFFFGRKVEDVLGPIKFTIFYFVCIYLSHLGAILGETVLPLTHGALPYLGSSGAIMGVVGAYLFLYQNERIRTLPLLLGIIPIPWLPRLRVSFFILWMIAGDVVNRLLQEQFQAVGKMFSYTGSFTHLTGVLVGMTVIYLFLPKEMLHFRYRSSQATQTSERG
jgi:membrane associated rhomboid family serine protease